MKEIHFLAAYALAVVITYGHAHHHQQDYIVMYSGKRIEKDETQRVLGAALSSVCWPLYWSQHLWGDK